MSTTNESLESALLFLGVLLVIVDTSATATGCEQCECVVPPIVHVSGRAVTDSSLFSLGYYRFVLTIMDNNDQKEG